MPCDCVGSHSFFGRPCEVCFIDNITWTEYNINQMLSFGVAGWVITLNNILHIFRHLLFEWVVPNIQKPHISRSYLFLLEQSAWGKCVCLQYCMCVSAQFLFSPEVKGSIQWLMSHSTALLRVIPQPAAHKKEKKVYRTQVVVVCETLRCKMGCVGTWIFVD